MFRRLLLSFVGALALGATCVQAQPVPDFLAPEVCRLAPGQRLEELEARKQRLERLIADEGGTNASEAPSRALRKSQEELLEVIFLIECARGTEAASVTRRGIPRSVTPAVNEVVEITTYYATNRNQARSSDPAKVYGADVEGTLHYGRAVVTIPLRRTPGTVGLPSLWRLEREPDPNKHFVLKSVTPLGSDAARVEMAEKLRTSDSRSILIFVHGFNMGFRDAAFRTAQMAHDLQFRGMAFFYSWPSANRVTAYWQDEEVARFSEGVFERLLDDLSQLPVTDIYIVAHSMGNRIVAHGLQSRVEKGKDTSRVRELLLAAPDINADIFRTVIAPRLAAMQGTRTTVYASSSDVALRASKIVHGFRRVGETTGGVLTFPGLETVDASGAASMTRAFGHLYVMDNPSVLKDIESIIRQKAPAGARGLSEMGTSPNHYWRLQ
jgi:esterase/lipase superfamily enzyme